MKRKSILMFWIASIILLTGCGDDTPTTVNAITLDGDAFKITAPSLIGVSIDGEGHAAISFANATSSSSKVLSIDFEYSPNEDIDGTYSYPQEGTDRYLDEFLTSYTEFSGNNFYSTELESGSITIKNNSGDNYTVTLDLTMVDGKKFEGKYSGKFQVAFNNQ